MAARQSGSNKDKKAKAVEAVPEQPPSLEPPEDDEPLDVHQDDPEDEDDEPVTVGHVLPQVLAEPPSQVARRATKRCRVKGTWQMVWGQYQFDFVDDHVYDLPLDLYNYLKAHGNIYDTAR